GSACSRCRRASPVPNRPFSPQRRRRQTWRRTCAGSTGTWTHRIRVCTPPTPSTSRWCSTARSSSSSTTAQRSHSILEIRWCRTGPATGGKTRATSRPGLPCSSSALHTPRCRVASRSRMGSARSDGRRIDHGRRRHCVVQFGSSRWPFTAPVRRLPADTAVLAHTGLVGTGDRHRADRRGRCGEPDRHKFVGRSEIFVVTIELAILAVFVVLGLTRADPGRFADNGGHSWLGIFFAAGLLYVTYEGFGVVTNSAADMRDPARELPRAMFQALGIVMVVYVLVSAVIVMTLTLPTMAADQGHVLSDAGEQ